MNLEERIERLRLFHSEGRVVQNKWGNETHGCVLAIISPECQVRASADYCPESVMPSWLAPIVPWMNDALSPGGHRTFVTLFIQLLPHLHKLPGSAEAAIVRAQMLSDVVTAIHTLQAEVEKVKHLPAASPKPPQAARLVPIKDYWNPKAPPAPVAVLEADAMLEAAVIAPVVAPMFTPRAYFWSNDKEIVQGDTSVVMVTMPNYGV